MFKNAKSFASFSVDNIEKAREFYGQTLGLEMADVMGMMELHMGDGSRVFVYAKPNHVPATFTVLNFIVDDVEKAVGDLTQAGVKFEIYNSPDVKTDQRGIATGDRGPKMAWFKDPARNILSVLEAK